MTLTLPRVGMRTVPHHSIDTYRNGWLLPLGTVSSSFAWGTQYRAIYVPIRVTQRVVVKKMGYLPNTGAGNIDIGIYDAGGTRLVSSGSTALAGTGTTSVVDVTDTTIGPGLYYFALNNDTTTDTMLSDTTAAPVAVTRGVLTETLGSVVLPATASWAIDQTLAGVPVLIAMLNTVVA